MKHIIISLFVVLLLTLSASAEEVSLQASVPGDAGTIALRVTLNEAQSAVLENSSGLSPEPEPSAVPEPATLGLGVLGLLLWQRRIANNDTGKRES